MADKTTRRNTREQIKVMMTTALISGSTKTPVPESTTITLLGIGIGLAGLVAGASRRRLKKAKQYYHK